MKDKIYVLLWNELEEFAAKLNEEEYFELDGYLDHAAGRLAKLLEKENQ